MAGLALAFAWCGCGDSALRLENLVGAWEYEACTWGAEGSRQVPCENFRPLGTIEISADSTVAYWISGKQSFLQGRITRMDFKGQGGLLAGQAQGDSRQVEAEVRLQDGKLIYTLRLPDGLEEGMQGTAEHGILRRK